MKKETKKLIINKAFRGKTFKLKNSENKLFQNCSFKECEFFLGIEKPYFIKFIDANFDNCDILDSKFHIGDME